MRRFLLTSLLFLAGCSHKQQTYDITFECFDKKMGNDEIIPILKDVSRRFPKAHVFISHGIDLRYIWFTKDEEGFLIPLQFIADRESRIHPDKPIVFWVCNKNHNSLDGQGVFYFKEMVWQKPDEDTKNYILENRMWTEREVEFNWGSSGSIFEAIEGN